MYIEGDVPYVGTNNCNGNNGFFGGSGWEGIIGLIVVAGLFGGGWGFGGFGGNRGGSPATQADLSAGFANSEIMSDLNDIILGQASMQNFINQGFAGVNATVTNGFAGVNNAICTLGFQNQSGFNALSTQLAQCCCDTRAAIADVKYANERQTCDLITNANANTQRIIDYMQNEKINALQAENVALKGRISNSEQSAYIINALNPPARPSYIVPKPNCCYNQGCGFGFNNII